jgi:nucleoside-diphosphate-sugar epimerase
MEPVALLIFGLGYCGRAIGAAVQAAGGAVRGTRPRPAPARAGAGDEGAARLLPGDDLRRAVERIAGFQQIGCAHAIVQATALPCGRYLMDSSYQTARPIAPGIMPGHQLVRQRTS